MSDFEREQHYRTLIRDDPHDLESYRQLGPFLKEVGRLGDAIEVYREAIRVAPGAAWAHFRLAYALECGGAPEDALADCREVIPALQRLVDTDDGVSPRWGRIRDEAREAIQVIEGRAA
jgi:tetratricopeptide (TPR) repeat protein